MTDQKAEQHALEVWAKGQGYEILNITQHRYEQNKFNINCKHDPVIWVTLDFEFCRQLTEGLNDFEVPGIIVRTYIGTRICACGGKPDHNQGSATE